MKKTLSLLLSTLLILNTVFMYPIRAEGETVTEEATQEVAEEPQEEVEEIPEEEVVSEPEEIIPEETIEEETLLEQADSGSNALGHNPDYVIEHYFQELNVTNGEKSLSYVYDEDFDNSEYSDAPILVATDLEPPLDVEGYHLAGGEYLGNWYGDTIISVNYIESDGNQFIDLDYYPTSDTFIYSKFQLVDKKTDHQVLFGVKDSLQPSVGLYFSADHDDSNPKQLEFKYGVNQSTSLEQLERTVDSDIHEMWLGYDWELEHDALYFDNILYEPINGTFYDYNINNDLYLFAGNYSGTGEPTNFGSYRLYHMYIGEDYEGYKYDLYPAFNIDDQEYGLYDKLSGTFYTNDGWGDFTCSDAPFVVNDDDPYTTQTLRLFYDLDSLGIYVEGYDYEDEEDQYFYDTYYYGEEVDLSIYDENIEGYTLYGMYYDDCYDYSSGTYYDYGDLVARDGGVYFCIVDGTYDYWDNSQWELTPLYYDGGAAYFPNNGQTLEVADLLKLSYTSDYPDSDYGMDLYADYYANGYMIMYNYAGGEPGHGMNPTYAVYNERPFQVADPYKPGYIFGGWVINGMDACTHYINGEETNEKTYETFAKMPGDNDYVGYETFKNLSSYNLEGIFEGAAGYRGVISALGELDVTDMGVVLLTAKWIKNPTPDEYDLDDYDVRYWRELMDWEEPADFDNLEWFTEDYSDEEGYFLVSNGRRYVEMHDVVSYYDAPNTYYRFDGPLGYYVDDVPIGNQIIAEIDDGYSIYEADSFGITQNGYVYGDKLLTGNTNSIDDCRYIESNGLISMVDLDDIDPSTTLEFEEDLMQVEAIQPKDDIFGGGIGDTIPYAHSIDTGLTAGEVYKVDMNISPNSALGFGYVFGTLDFDSNELVNSLVHTVADNIDSISLEDVLDEDKLLKLANIGPTLLGYSLNLSGDPVGSPMTVAYLCGGLSYDISSVPTTILAPGIDAGEVSTYHISASRTDTQRNLEIGLDVFDMDYYDSYHYNEKVLDKTGEIKGFDGDEEFYLYGVPSNSENTSIVSLYLEAILSGYYDLYDAKIYGKNGKLLRDFVPCVTVNTIDAEHTNIGKDILPGVYGLYDKVTNKFYTTKDKGEFSGKFMGQMYMFDNNEGISEDSYIDLFDGAAGTEEYSDIQTLNVLLKRKTYNVYTLENLVHNVPAFSNDDIEYFRYESPQISGIYIDYVPDFNNILYRGNELDITRDFYTGDNYFTDKERFEEEQAMSLLFGDVYNLAVDDENYKRMFGYFNDYEGGHSYSDWQFGIFRIIDKQEYKYGDEVDVDSLFNAPAESSANLIDNKMLVAGDYHADYDRSGIDYQYYCPPEITYEYSSPIDETFDDYHVSDYIYNFGMPNGDVAVINTYLPEFTAKKPEVVVNADWVDGNTYYVSSDSLVDLIANEDADIYFEMKAYCDTYDWGFLGSYVDKYIDGIPLFDQYALDEEVRADRFELSAYAYERGKNISDVATYTFVLVNEIDFRDIHHLFAELHEDGIPTGLWIGDIKDVRYNPKNSSYEPSFNVYYGTRRLDPSEYTVKYSNNKNAGIATVKVTGKGGYSGTLTSEFRIGRRRLNEENVIVTLSADAFRENNKSQKPTISELSYVDRDGNTYKLKNGKDFTVYYTTASYGITDSKDAGEYLVNIEGIGNYSTRNPISIPYRIIKKDDQATLLSKLKISGIKDVDVYTYMYDYGRELPIVVKDGSKVLTPWVDYFISYDGETLFSETNDTISNLVGKHTVTIIGDGKKYAGSITKTFTISPINMSKLTYGGKPELTVEYDNGKTFKPVHTLTYKGMEVPIRLYTVRYLDSNGNEVTPINPGTYTIVYEGNPEAGIFTGSKKFTMKIKGNSLSKFNKVDYSSETFYYTGEPIEIDSAQIAPYYTQTVSGVTQKNYLTTGNYDYEYLNNVNPGTATVVYTGLKSYYGSTLKKTFKINKYPLDKDPYNMISYRLIGEQTYAKNGTKPLVEIKQGDYVLVEGVDYTITCKNNKKVGSTATATIKGKGNYTGTLPAIEFEIAAQNIYNCVMTADDTTSAKLSVPVIKDQDGATLKLGTDYTNVKYFYVYDTAIEDTSGSKSNEPGIKVIRKAGEEVGRYDVVYPGTVLRVTADGIGNYYGTITTSYKVVEGNINNAKVTISTQYYTGKAINLYKEDITVIAEGKELYPEDYEIVGYTNNTNVGTGTVTLRGKGKFGGTITAKFTIAKQPVNSIIIQFHGRDNFDERMYAAEYPYYETVVSGTMNDLIITKNTKLTKNKFKNSSGESFKFWWAPELGDGDRVFYDGEEINFNYLAENGYLGKVIDLYAQYIPWEDYEISLE